MRVLDQFLQRLRYEKVGAFINPGDRVLDIGCYDGSFLERHACRATVLMGVDTHLTKSDASHSSIVLIEGTVDDVPMGSQFDKVTAMAVLEHLTTIEDAQLARRLMDLTTADARFIVTVPSPLVDKILDVFIRLKFLDGMDTEAHHGQSIEELKSTFDDNGWTIEIHRRFQLGLNNLIVFKRKK